MAQQKKGKKETAKKSEEDSKTAVENNKGSTEVVEKGKKIAQLVFQKVEYPEIEEVKELDSTTRGERGFGSTGLD